MDKYILDFHDDPTVCKQIMKKRKNSGHRLDHWMRLLLLIFPRSELKRVREEHLTKFIKNDFSSKPYKNGIKKLKPPHIYSKARPNFERQAGRAYAEIRSIIEKQGP